MRIIRRKFVQNVQINMLSCLKLVGDSLPNVFARIQQMKAAEAETNTLHEAEDQEVAAEL